MFFFSSRRRHTICLSDWSSDVCSSDLGAEGQLGAGRPVGEQRTRENDRLVRAHRSEERRVGKESKTVSRPRRTQTDALEACGERFQKDQPDNAATAETTNKTRKRILEH